LGDRGYSAKLEDEGLWAYGSGQNCPRSLPSAQSMQLKKVCTCRKRRYSVAKDGLLERKFSTTFVHRSKAYPNSRAHFSIACAIVQGSLTTRAPRLRRLDRSFKHSFAAATSSSPPSEWFALISDHGVIYLQRFFLSSIIHMFLKTQYIPLCVCRSASFCSLGTSKSAMLDCLVNSSARAAVAAAIVVAIDVPDSLTNGPVPSLATCGL
jgi:hypothetical protein